MKNEFTLNRWVLSILLAMSSIMIYAQTTETDLTTHEPMSVPSGATFEWREGPMPTSDLVTTPEAVSPGLYYGFYKFDDDCYSEGTPISVITNECPSTTVDLNSVLATPAGNESFHSSLPVSDENEITQATVSEAATGATYYVAFKTIEDNTSCYSEPSVIAAVATSCRPNTTDAIDDINNTLVNTSVPGNVLTNDEDPEGNTQTVTQNTNPSNGNVVVNPDGSYVYTPNMNFTGEDTFTYTICDDGNPVACDEANVVIEVLPSNDPENNPPVANNDTQTTEVDEPVVINVLPNDFDQDGDNITVTSGSLSDPANGVAVLNPDGTVTYTPDPGFEGEDTFTYEICDDGNPSLCDEATVTVTITPEPLENVTYANDDAYTGTIDTPIPGSVLDNDEDPEGDIQTVNTTPVVDPEHGTVVLNSDGTFIYTPDAGYTGPDSYVYSLCDDGMPQACDEATVILTIGLADPCDEDAVSYLTADCDGDGVPNGDELTPPNGEAPTDPTNPCDFIASDITLTPSAAFLADDCDNDGVTNGDELTPPDGEAPTNPLDPCDFVTADITLTPDATFLADDCDGDGVTNGDELTPPNGENPTDPKDPCDFIVSDITLTASAAFLADDCDNDGVPNGDELTPPDGENPTDPTNPCDFVTADITLTPSAAFLADDCDNDGVPNGDELTPPDGEAPTDPLDPCDFIVSDITLTPSAAFLADDCDGDGVTNGDELTPPDGEAPTDPQDPCDFIVSDITLTASAAFLADDCDNDGVPNGDELTPPDGEAPTNPLDPCDFVTADITLTPDATFLADDCDGDGVTNGDELTPPDGEAPTDPQDPCDFIASDITLQVTANEICNTTEAVDDQYIGQLNTPVTGNVTDNDEDLQGDDQIVNTTPVQQPLNGSVVLNPDGSFVYTPNSGFTGNDSFVYEVCDDGTPVACDQATVILSINGPDDPCDTNAASYLTADCDGDGVPNGDELTPPDGENPTDPTNPCDFVTADITLTPSSAFLADDCDGDGVPNGDELTPPDGENPTDPLDPCDFIVSDITLTASAAFLADDCDNDGVPNGDELTPPDGENPTDPTNPCDFVTADITLTPSAAFLADDCDNDGVPNGDELTPPDGEAPTNPLDPCDFVTADITLTPDATFLADDCDGDGVTNGDELTPPDGEAPTDPQDPCDFIASDITVQVTTTENCTPVCPSGLTSIMAPEVVVTNSTCPQGQTSPSGGFFTAAYGCPNGSTIQYSVFEGPWTTQVPTYNQTTSMDVRTRCNCNVNTAISSYIAVVTTQPASCNPGNNPCTYTNIDFEDFEHGWGIWNDGGYDAYRNYEPEQGANGSNYCIRLRDNSGKKSSMFTDQLDLRHASEVRLDFVYLAKSMEHGEDFILEYSTDGGYYFHKVKTWVAGVDFTNDNPVTESVKFSGNFSAKTVIRIRVDASSNGDQVYFDNVSIDACVGGNPSGNQPNPVDCVVSAWSDWSECTETCGGGYKTRTRTVLVSAIHGGDSCPILTETIPCNTRECEKFGCDDEVVCENESFEHGWGIWNDGGGDAAKMGYNMLDGTYQARLRDNSGSKSSIYTNSFDLSQNESVEVKFSFVTISFDNANEGFLFEYTTDEGQNWHTLKRWSLGADFDNNKVYNVKKTFNELSMNHKTRFRFRADASSNNDMLLLDEVDIKARCYNSLTSEETTTQSRSRSLSLQEVGMIENLEEFTSFDIKVSPNPASDYFRVELQSEMSDEVRVEIYNVQGQLMITKQLDETSLDNSVTLDGSKLNSGAYIVKAYDTVGNSAIKRLIIVD